MNIFGWFKISDKTLFNKLGKSAYIRNGVGYGFVSDEYLYNNCLLEIGIGGVTSGYGDWGGGFSQASDSPLKVIIDRNFIIHKVSTASFYNSESSKKVEKIAKKLSKKLKIGEKFKVTNKEFKNGIKQIFSVIPCKSHIGWDVFDSPHMLEYFTSEENMSCYRIPEPTNKN